MGTEGMPQRVTEASFMPASARYFLTARYTARRPMGCLNLVTNSASWSILGRTSWPSLESLAGFIVEKYSVRIAAFAANS